MVLKKKKELDARDIALIRIEQIYPFPHNEFNKIIKKYPQANLHLWVQEEPVNMGAWMYLSHEVKQIDWIPVCRASSAGADRQGFSTMYLRIKKQILRITMP